MESKAQHTYPNGDTTYQIARPIEPETMIHQTQNYEPNRYMEQLPAYTEQTRHSENLSSISSTTTAMSCTQQSSHLPEGGKVIAIPSTTPKLGSPFLRAYPPALHQHTISRELFLGFIDDLNRCMVASPPLQILGLAGNVVSQTVPLATAQIVGGAVSAAATFGTVAVSKGRMEILLRDSNRTIFNPRGLKVEIVKLEALARAAAMPILTDSGKIDKKASLLNPIESADLSITGQQRRLDALEPWIAELDLEPLPELATPDNPLSKWSAGASEKQRTKGEEKMMKRRREAHEKHEKETAKADKEFGKEIRKLDKEEEKVRRKEEGKKLEEELRKIEKERAKAQKEFDKKTTEAEKDKRKESKEEEHMRKILWLMVTTTTGSDE